jgi:predicted MFS family arabinose efflux permease
MEGILTCILGIIAYFALVPFPEKAYGTRFFLKDRELDFVIAHIDKDREDVELEPFNIRKYLKAGLDWKVWGFFMIYFCLTTTAYAVAFSLPIILLKGMGFDLAEAQCLVAPPYVLACILIYITGWIGDKYRISAPIFFFHACLTITGLALIGWTKGNGTRYFGVFLTTACANANIPTVMTYQANNIRGQWKRAFCSATFVTAGSMGGIAGSLVFRTQDAPMYHNGIYACIA